MKEKALQMTRVIERFKKYVQSARNDYAIELRDSPKYWALSAITYGLYIDLAKEINKKEFGSLLDAGAGGLNAKSLFIKNCQSYTSLDIEDRTGEIDIIEDIQDMRSVKDKSFDTVYSSQVLEHIQSPSKAIQEFKRILKNKGVCIVSVPHLSHYHEEPNV